MPVVWENDWVIMEPRYVFKKMYSVERREVNVYTVLKMITYFCEKKNHTVDWVAE